MSRNSKNVGFSWIGALWFILGFVLILIVGSQLSWSTWYPPLYAISVIPVVFFAYAIAFFLSFRLVAYPIRNRILLITLIVLTTHIGSFALTAVFRFTYSRLFITISLLLTLLWICVGYVASLRERSKKKVALLQDKYSKELTCFPDYHWIEISEVPSKIDLDYSMIGADLHGPLPDKWKRFLADASLSGIPIFDSAKLCETLTGRVSLSHLADSSIDEIKTHYPYYLPFKRFVDLSFILLFSPIILFTMVLIMIAIRVESRGPIFFVQERVGYRNQIFKMYKFRSMSNQDTAQGSNFTGRGDQRITHVGRVLRKHRLDEIPQLIHVLNGKMSLIGPRPEQQDFVNEYNKKIAFYPYRHSMKPGITGWAQVSQGYTSSEESTRKKLEHDFYYIKHVSPWLDLLILIKTFNTIIGGYGSRY